MDNLPTEPFLVALLPLPTSANKLYKNAPWVTSDGRRTSRRILSDEYLAFQQEAILLLRRSKINQSIVELIREHTKNKQFLPLRLESRFYVKSLWGGDTDNRIKGLQDTIFKVFLNLNDVLVTQLCVEKFESLHNPHCKVRLSFAQIDGGSDEW